MKIKIKHTKDYYIARAKCIAYGRGIIKKISIPASLFSWQNISPEIDINEVNAIKAIESLLREQAVERRDYFIKKFPELKLKKDDFSIKIGRQPKLGNERVGFHFVRLRIKLLSLEIKGVG